MILKRKKVRDKGKDYIVKSISKDGGKKVEVEKSYRTRFRDYVKHHWASTVLYGTGLFCIVDGLHKTYHGQFDEVKDEVYLGLLLVGGGKAAKVLNEEPKKEKEITDLLGAIHDADYGEVGESIQELMKDAPKISTEYGKRTYAVKKLGEILETNVALRKVSELDGRKIVNPNDLPDPSNLAKKLALENMYMSEEFMKEDAPAYSD